VEVHLSQQRVKAEECAECETEKGFVHIIEKKIKLIGDIDENQRARLLDISDRCPVNRTLLSEIRIHNSLIS
jgi:putative redox protein